MSDPALLSDEADAVERVEQKFEESIERKIKGVEMSRKDRDSILARQFHNELYKDDPERQILTPDEKLAVIKSISLDDVREFFREHIFFDNKHKIIMNNSALEAGLSSDKLAGELLKLNSNDTKKKQAQNHVLEKY